MSIYQKPNGRWAAQVYDRSRRRMRQVGVYETRRKAQRAEVEALAAQEDGVESLTVREWSERWLDLHPKPADSTAATYVQNVRPFVARYGDRPMGSITVDDAREWATRGVAGWESVRVMFTDARRSKVVAANPFSDLGLARPRGRRDLKGGWITLEQIESLADAALLVHGDYGVTVAAMIRFAAWTGVRPGEMFGLAWDDLYPDRGEIEVVVAARSKTRSYGPPKNGHPRTIAYPQGAVDAVASIARQAHPDGERDFVFRTRRGRPFFSPALSLLWTPVRTVAGRPGMDFYELRHFAATHMMEHGLASYEVAHQLGHRDNGRLVEQTYGHPNEAAIRAKVKTALDATASVSLAARRAAASR